MSFSFISIHAFAKHALSNISNILIEIIFMDQFENKVKQVIDFEIMGLVNTIARDSRHLMFNFCTCQSFQPETVFVLLLQFEKLCC